MANRSYLLYPESEHAEDTFGASEDRSCKHGLPLFWLALFAAADLKTYPHRELAQRGVTDDDPGSDPEAPWGVLVAPVAAAVARLAARRDALLAGAGDELAADLDEFAAGLALCPYRLVALSFREIQAMDDDPAAYLDRLRGALAALDSGWPDAVALARGLQQGEYFGYDRAHDRGWVFPWLKGAP